MLVDISLMVTTAHGMIASCSSFPYRCTMSPHSPLSTPTASGCRNHSAVL